MSSDATSWLQALLNGLVPALIVGALGFGGVVWTIRSQNENLRRTFVRQEELLREQLERQDRQRRADRLSEALEDLDNAAKTAAQKTDAKDIGIEAQREAGLAVLAALGPVMRYSDLLGDRFVALVLEAIDSLTNGLRALEAPDGETPSASEVLSAPVAALGFLANRWLVSSAIPDSWVSMDALLVDVRANLNAFMQPPSSEGPDGQ